MSVTANDDGYNAASNDDSVIQEIRPGQDNSNADGSIFIRISGGTVMVNASGDGLDSNGDLFVDGGTILVNGPTTDRQGALDYNNGNGISSITGGVLVANRKRGYGCWISGNINPVFVPLRVSWIG